MLQELFLSLSLRTTQPREVSTVSEQKPYSQRDFPQEHPLQIKYAIKSDEERLVSPKYLPITRKDPFAPFRDGYEERMLSSSSYVPQKRYERRTPGCNYFQSMEAPRTLSRRAARANHS